MRFDFNVSAVISKIFAAKYTKFRRTTLNCRQFYRQTEALCFIIMHGLLFKVNHATVGNGGQFKPNSTTGASKASKERKSYSENLQWFKFKLKPGNPMLSYMTFPFISSSSVSRSQYLWRA